MSFLAVGFLAGLAAIAGPIVIHLIHRQRYPERPFTTLRFFDTTIKNNTLQTRLIDRVLLMLRVLALAALALGLARPFVNLPLGERGLSVVILLDNSPSMARTRDGTTLFENAREHARKIVAALGPHDRVDVVLTCPGLDPLYTADTAALLRELDSRAGRPTALLVRGPGAQTLSVPGMQRDTAPLRNAISKLTPQDQAALVSYDDTPRLTLDDNRARVNALLDRAAVSSMPPAPRRCLERAASALASSTDGDRALIVLSDLRKSAWLNTASADQSSAALDGLRILVVPVDPGSSAANLAIDSCEADEPESTMGQVVTGTALIHNYGPGAAGPSTLAITTGIPGRTAEVKIPAIEPKAALRVTFPIRVMSRDRGMLCTAVLTSSTDPYLYDNSWNFQVGVRPPITALCVNGQGGGTNRSGFFIVNALSPRSASGAQSEAMADPRECDVADLRDQQLFQYGVVILAGVPTLNADAREKLRQFVSDGGGLLVFPPHTASPDEYNGWSFLPARITQTKTDTLAFIRTVADREPAVAELRDRAGSAVSALSANNWLLLEPAKDAVVLAAHADGSPALVERHIGRGKVIMAAEGAHLADSDWPIRPAFVILVRGLVRYLGAPSIDLPMLPQRDVGQSAATLIPAELRQGTPSLFRVGVSTTALELSPIPFGRNGDALLLPPASLPGHYLLTAAPGSLPGLQSAVGVGAAVTPISVNHSASESDLTPTAATDYAGLFPGAVLTQKSLLDDPAAIAAELYTGRDLWRYILVLALIVLAAESLIAWRWASDAAS